MVIKDLLIFRREPKTELSSLGVNDKIPFVSDRNGHVCYAFDRNGGYA